MSLDPKKTYSLQPTREYEIRGGPLAKNLGEVDVKILAEIVRSGPEDSNAQRR